MRGLTRDLGEDLETDAPDRLEAGLDFFRAELRGLGRALTLVFFMVFRRGRDGIAPHYSCRGGIVKRVPQE